MMTIFVISFLFRRYKEDMSQLQTLVEVATGRQQEDTAHVFMLGNLQGCDQDCCKWHNLFINHTRGDSVIRKGIQVIGG